MTDKLHEQLQQKTKTIEFSGTAQVFYKTHNVFKIAKGYRNRAEELPITDSTRFGIASGTKFFTALGIMRLVEEGKCQLDDPAFSYIKTPFANDNQNVTIRQLLTHTSGIPDYFDESMLDDENNLFLDIPWYDLKKPSDYLPLMPNRPMEFTPGSKFKYNNSAFVLLAVIIEELTGDYFEWIQDQIFTKASMTHSGAYAFNQLPSNTALGYIEEDDGTVKTNIYHLPIIAGGDGGMYTNLKDMALFWEALLAGDIVKKSTLNDMITPHYTSDKITYGLGVWLERFDDTYTITFSGEDAGVSFKTAYYPKRDITFTVMSNTHDGAWPMVKAIEEVIKKG